MDPDDWVRKSGAKVINKNIDNPTSFLDFHLEFHHGIELDGAERQKYIRNLAKELRSIDDGIIRNDLVRMLSEKLLVAEEDLFRIIRTQRVNQVYEARTENNQEEDKVSFTNVGARAQIELLQLLVNPDKDIRKSIREKISIDLFTEPLLQRIAKIILDEKLNVETAEIIEYFQDKKERDSVVQILFTEVQNIPPEQIVTDCLKILKSIPLKDRIQSLRIIIRDKEAKGEDPQEELNEVIILRQELNEI
tara:strand:- start:1272 stop:2018 length:747 start_codon:yes stop_codon:yes gene_type:complete